MSLRAEAGGFTSKLSSKNDMEDINSWHNGR
ncbi:hypothetical protein SAMN05216368_11522 [Cryobacterium flavum]|uniref:Uncharacterized protein n=1 Tax=Cryobacterium flavum TaxID=1424659 RepID=A0A5E9G3A0_9MICO|nr:hypothetical protein SAMN05216368_11522 [Cryobacterium flavum]